MLIAAVALQLGTDRDFERAFIAACTAAVVGLLVAILFSGVGALRLAPRRGALIPRDSEHDFDPEPREPHGPMGGTVLFWTLFVVAVQLATAVFVLSL